MALELEETPPKRDGRKERGDRTETLVSYVRERILDDIVQGYIGPSEVFQLRALADRYGVSKTPVREALSQLQREGLVDSLPYKGYMVRPMDLTEFNEIFHLRGLLEGAAAELAASHISQSELDELAAMSPPDDTVGMSLDYDAYSHRFHALIARASGSRRLLEMFEKLYTDVRRLQSSGIGRPSAYHSSEEHDDIIQALARRDPAGAREAMIRHVENIKARALENRGPLPTPLPLTSRSSLTTVAPTQDSPPQRWTVRPSDPPTVTVRSGDAVHIEYPIPGISDSSLRIALDLRVEAAGPLSDDVPGETPDGPAD